MTQLTITQAKPNPFGKDRLGNYIPFSQLAGEWIDFKNTGDEVCPLSGVELHHIAYTSSYPNGVWNKVMGFSGNLGVEKIVRVHSGWKISLESISQEDLVGADYHLFTGSNYVWNNAQGDTPRLILRQNGQIYELDKASYSTNPPEGRILVRNGTRLI
jgi:hypothetical protein